MSQVFISYSHDDKNFAIYLAHRLSLRGLEIWIDESKLFGGDDLHAKIRLGLEASDALLFIISPKSLQSPNVAKEWKYFSEYCSPRPIIPLMLKAKDESMALMPQQLANLFFLEDFVNLGGFESGFARIIQALKIQGLDVIIDEHYSVDRRHLKYEDAKNRQFYLREPQAFLSMIEYLLALFGDAKAFYAKDLIDRTMLIKRSLWGLIDGKIEDNGSWKEIGRCLNWIFDCLSDRRLPLYMNDLYDRFFALMNYECLLVNPDRRGVIFDYLPIDENLLHSINSSAKEAIQEYVTRQKVKRGYIFPLDQISNVINATGMNIALSSVTAKEQLPVTETRISLGLGDVKAHWQYAPAPEEVRFVSDVAEKFMKDQFWYLSKEGFENLWVVSLPCRF